MKKFLLKRIFIFFLVPLLFHAEIAASPQAAISYASPLSWQVDQALATMTLEEKVGQLFMVRVGSDIDVVFQNFKPGGVILFSKDAQTVTQVLELTQRMQALAGSVPLFIAIDQEGGRVIRLAPGTSMPGNMALGATRSAELTRKTAQIIGSELAALGITIDLAPVLDVNNNPDNPVIGVRSFGDDPLEVARLGVSYIQGLHDAGIAATAKHFPGHGDTAIDSHLSMPSIPYSLERLERVEWVPFRAAVKVGVDLVMVGHIRLSGLDVETDLPASLSHQALTDILRDRIGFEGIVISDALNMGAITSQYQSDQASLLAFQAGCDILLMPDDLDSSYKAVLSAVQSGIISESRLNQSVRRILLLKLRQKALLNPPLAAAVPSDPEQKIFHAGQFIANPSHRSFERDVSDRATTLVRNDTAVLPFRLADNQRLLFFAPWSDRLEPMIATVNEIIASKSLTGVFVQGFSYENLDSMTHSQQAALASADFVIIGSYNFNAGAAAEKYRWLNAFAANAVQSAASLSKPAVVLSIRDPYDAALLTEAKAFVAIYGTAGGPNIPAGIRAIFGLTNPTGKLPVAIPSRDRQTILYPSGFGLSY